MTFETLGMLVVDPASIASELSGKDTGAPERASALVDICGVLSTGNATGADNSNNKNSNEFPFGALKIFSAAGDGADEAVCCTSGSALEGTTGLASKSIKLLESTVLFSFGFSFSEFGLVESAAFCYI